MTDPTTERARSADGTEIAFELAGDGRPLVVVGGALNARGSAGPLVEALSSSFTVIAYDRRGRGDSGDTAPYAVEREIEDLVAVIRAVGGPALLLGHSSGAALALEAARGRSDVDALVVYEPPFVVDDTRPPVPDGYVRRLDELVGDGRRGDAVAYFLEAGVGLPRAAVDGMRVSPMWPSLEGSRAHARLRRPRDGRSHDRSALPSGRVGRGDRSGARGRRGRQPRVAAEQRASARGCAPQRRAPHPRWSDA